MDRKWPEPTGIRSPTCKDYTILAIDRETQVRAVGTRNSNHYNLCDSLSPDCPVCFLGAPLEALADSGEASGCLLALFNDRRGSFLKVSW